MSRLLCVVLITILGLCAIGRGADVGAAAKPASRPLMYFAEETRAGKPFAKDPDVVKWGGRYLMYYTVSPYQDGRANDGFGIAIAESDDLVNWKKKVDFERDQAYEEKGACAPCVVVLNGKIHLFYQTYGNWRTDAICHAWSEDGIHFTKNPENPVWRPSGDWTCGRAIDADVIADGDRVLLYAATRDPEMQIQKLVVASAPLDSAFGKKDWTQLCTDSILQPELAWEKKCIEAAAVFKKGGLFYMFYAGGYNNEPQQIGIAVSKDGVQWTRLSRSPLLPNGEPGAWNASESGHPGVFTDDDGQVYLFFQGNNDNGATWFLSKMRVEWDGALPYLVEPGTDREYRLIDPVELP